MVRAKESPQSQEHFSDGLSLHVGFGVLASPRHRRWILHIHAQEAQQRGHIRVVPLPAEAFVPRMLGS